MIMKKIDVVCYTDFPCCCNTIAVTNNDTTHDIQQLCKYTEGLHHSLDDTAHFTLTEFSVQNRQSIWLARANGTMAACCRTTENVIVRYSLYSLKYFLWSFKITHFQKTRFSFFCLKNEVLIFWKQRHVITEWFIYIVLLDCFVFCCNTVLARSEPRSTIVYSIAIIEKSNISFLILCLSPLYNNNC